MNVKRQECMVTCCDRGITVKALVAASLLLTGSMLATPARANGSDTSFLEPESQAETLDDKALQALRAGENEGTVPSSDTDVDAVAVQLWDGWRQKGPQNGGIFDGSSASASSVVTINGISQ